MAKRQKLNALTPERLSENPKRQGNPTLEQLLPAIEAVAAIDRSHDDFGRTSHKQLIGAVEKATACEPLSARLRAALERWRRAISPRKLTPQEQRELAEAERIAFDESIPYDKSWKSFQTLDRLGRITTALKEERKLIERISRLLSGSDGPSIDATDAVGAAIAADLGKSSQPQRVAWGELLEHARALSATSPSMKWKQRAVELLDRIGDDKASGERLSDWLSRVGQRAPVERMGAFGNPIDPTLLNDASEELLKGLAWLIAAAKRVDLAGTLGSLADACFKKVPGHGPRNVKVANAAVAALAALAEPEAGVELARLRTRAKHPSSRATVVKAMNALGTQTGLSPDDLAEMSVPTFGLDADGVRRSTLGNCTAELRVAGSRRVELRWFGPKGKASKSVPAAVKEHHSDTVTQLKREAKNASEILTSQGLRLERLFMSERRWDLATWRQRYLDHPLLAALSRRLIWYIGETPAIWHDGRLVDADDRAVAAPAGASVRLWHPVDSSPAAVLTWRRWLEDHRVVQPFKQAHREIYVLTDAERRTESYSNRFAAHVLRQHQFAALCQERGWSYRLQGQFDSDNVPTLTLPAHRLTAEFWVQGIENDISPAGIFLYVTTDQVRFGRSLEQVPPIVFSEVMRDVDLFVGVASVGNDPTWVDGGLEGRYYDYWHNYSFGELSESARTRHETLERLIPRLKIAPRCSLSERFLIVRGDRRTYKIHCGSGNILMEPNDQYLCIVRAMWREKDDTVFLPFEGDNTLSTIISKAFLLAADSKIKDPTILRQIEAN